MARARGVGVAQTVPVRGDVAANVAEHLRLVREAAKAKARVLVFPELSLTGYELDLANQLAFTDSDVRLEPLIEAAHAHFMTLIVGAPVRLDARLHIGAFILGSDRTVDVYTKHHLGVAESGAAESTVFEPGTLNPLVELDGRTAAVAVCADITHPSHAQQAAERGADMYLAGAFITPSGFEREAGPLKTYAEQHEMVVAFANYGGPSGGLSSAGRSAVWSEKGELLAQCGPSGSGVAVAP